MQLNAFLGVAQDHSETKVFDPAREADHRIANNLALIASSIRMQARIVYERTTSFRNEEVRLMLAEIVARIDAVGKLHKMPSDEPEGVVDIGEHLSKMCGSLKPFIASASPFELFCDFAPGCAGRSDEIMPIALIVTEMVMNAIKYAHPTGVRGRIDASCHHVDGNIVIEVCDDGVGLPEAFDVERDGGVGLNVVRALSSQLRAKSIFDSSPLGLRFALVLPNGQ
jgi:two-component sensor histidine kinase